MPTPKTRTSIAAILLFGLIAWLPFIRRPLSVDDHPIYQQAVYLSHDLSRPYQVAVRGMGWTRGNTPSENNPPLYLYAQALVVRAFGEAEWKAHTLQMIFNFIGVFAFFFLARRFTRYPLWSTLIWIFTPHFLITSNAILVDALLPAIMLLALLAWIRGWEDHHPLVLAIAAVLLGLVPLVKYTGFLAWAVAAGWTLWQGNSLRDRRWLYFLIPVAIFSGWMLLSARIYGASHVTKVAGGSMVRPSLFAAVEILEFLSGTTWIVALSAVISAKHDPKIGVIGIVGLMAFTGLALIFGFPSVVAFQAGLWAALSFVWIVSAVPFIRRSSGDGFLMGWVMLGLAGLWVARGWFCARYLVIVGPAIIWLTVNLLHDRVPTLIGSALFRNTTVAVLMAAALAMQQADYRRAVIDRRMAETLDDWISARPDHGAAYYPADSLSGLGFYLDKTGLWKPAEPEMRLERNDFCVAPERTVPLRFLPKMSAPMVVEKIEIRSRNPFRTFDFRGGAGFYGSIWAPLPFSFSRDPVEVFYIFRETGPDDGNHAT